MVEEWLSTPPEKSHLTVDKNGNRVFRACGDYKEIYIGQDKINLQKHCTDYEAGYSMLTCEKVDERTITDIDLVNPLKKKFDTEKQRRDKEDARLYKEILDKESSQNLSPVAAKLKKFQRD